MRRAALAAIALAVVAGAYVLYAHDPATSSFYPGCALRATTGFDCPGCGSTRALHHLLHGRVATAFRYNPLLFVLGAVLLPALPKLTRGEAPRYIARPWFAWGLAIAILMWWIVRNL